MTDKNVPTAKEQLDVFCELAKQLNYPKLEDEAMKEFNEFMTKCMDGGKSPAECAVEWNKKMEESETPEETKPENRQEMSAPSTPASDPKIDTVMQRLEALEKEKIAERTHVRDELVSKLKQLDGTFDEKRFLTALEHPCAVERGIGALTVYMEAIEHYKKLIPTTRTQMSLGSNELQLKKNEIAKRLFGVEVYDPTKIAEGL